jgi:hypothetical protein
MAKGKCCLFLGPELGEKNEKIAALKKALSASHTPPQPPPQGGG